MFVINNPIAWMLCGHICHLPTWVCPCVCVCGLVDLILITLPKRPSICSKRKLWIRLDSVWSSEINWSFLQSAKIGHCKSKLKMECNMAVHWCDAMRCDDRVDMISHNKNKKKEMFIEQNYYFVYHSNDLRPYMNLSLSNLITKRFAYSRIKLYLVFLSVIGVFLFILSLFSVFGSFFVLFYVIFVVLFINTQHLKAPVISLFAFGM